MVLRCRLSSKREVECIISMPVIRVGLKVDEGWIEDLKGRSLKVDCCCRLVVESVAYDANRVRHCLAHTPLSRIWSDLLSLPLVSFELVAITLNHLDSGVQQIAKIQGIPFLRGGRERGRDRDFEDLQCFLLLLLLSPRLFQESFRKQ